MKNLITLHFVIVFLSLCGCQSAYDYTVNGTSDFRPISEGPNHITYIVKSGLLTRLANHSQAHCSTHGKKSSALPWYDNSFYRHWTYACYSEAERSLVKQLMIEDGANWVRNFLRLKGVNTSSQIGVLVDVAGAAASVIPAENESTPSPMKAPIGYNTCTYRSGQFQWTETLKGICPASFKKGELVGILVP